MHVSTVDIYVRIKLSMLLRMSVFIFYQVLFFSVTQMIQIITQLHAFSVAHGYVLVAIRAPDNALMHVGSVMPELKA